MDILTQQKTTNTMETAPIRPDDPNLTEEQKELLRLIQEGIDDAEAGRVYPGPETLKAILSRHVR